MRGRYSDESEQALSRDIEWQISNRAVASISGAGELEGLRPGKTEVVARFGELRSPPVTVLVKEPEKPAQQPAKSMQAREPARRFVTRAGKLRRSIGGTGEGESSGAFR